VGGLTVGPGSLLAAVTEGDDAWTVTVEVPVLAPDALAAFGELVAAESGRIARLLAGELPHQLVEHAEESGVELLPYGGELVAECTCGAWTQPCRHALAVLLQFTWLVDADPLLLVLLRGLSREDLLAALHARTVAATDPARDPATDPAADRAAGEPDDPEVDAAYDAAVRAARVLELLAAAEQSGEVPDIDHLL
jgi:uncharacterized Zn finger protein